MNSKHKKIMRKAMLFQGINDKEYDTLISCLSPQIKLFSKNEILLLTGSSINHVGIVLSGTASAYLEHANGNKTLISNLAPMSVLGEVLASTRAHLSPVTVYAASDLMVAFIEREKIYAMCQAACSAHRKFSQNILKSIGDKYFYLFDRIAILREKTLRAKITAYLYSLSENGKITTVTIPYSKTMLADYLLANRSALSKELRKMEDDGLITVSGRQITRNESPESHGMKL